MPCCSSPLRIEEELNESYLLRPSITALSIRLIIATQLSSLVDSVSAVRVPRSPTTARASSAQLLVINSISKLLVYVKGVSHEAWSYPTPILMSRSIPARTLDCVSSSGVVDALVTT